MNLHINGIEMRTVELTIEFVEKSKKYRAMIKGDRAALNRVFKQPPAKLVLERGPNDPQLARGFQPGLDVRVRGHKYRVYRRDFKRNRIYLRGVIL